MKKSVLFFGAVAVFSLFLFVFGILVFNGDMGMYFTKGRVFAFGTVGVGIICLLISIVLGKLSDKAYVLNGIKRLKSDSKEMFSAVFGKKGIACFAILLAGAALSGVLFAVIPDSSGTGYTVVGFRIVMSLIPLAAAFGVMIRYLNKKK